MNRRFDERPIPRLPRWQRQGASGQRVALSGFLLAATMERADRISMLLAPYLETCRAAEGCLRAEIWRSRSEPMRFAVFLRFRCRQDYERHLAAIKGSDWWREVGPISDDLRLHPE